jgi:hypothetical protein
VKIFNLDLNGQAGCTLIAAADIAHRVGSTFGRGFKHHDFECQLHFSKMASRQLPVHTATSDAASWTSRLPRLLLLATFFAVIIFDPSYAAVDNDPKWKTDLPTGNQCLAKLITAISGKPNGEGTVQLLRGVDRISRSDKSITLHREDNLELQIVPGTIFGDKIFENFEKTKTDTNKYSGNLSEVLSGLKAIQVTGNHVEILREDPQNVSIQVSAGVKKLPFRLKEVRINRLSMDLDEGKGFPAVKNVSGLDVIVKVGVDFHIVPKEFWRTKNDRGDTTVTFGIVNPLPSAIKMALGLKEITYFSHTVRKKQERVSIDFNHSRWWEKGRDQTRLPLTISNKNSTPATTNNV